MKKYLLIACSALIFSCFTMNAQSDEGAPKVDRGKDVTFITEASGSSLFEVELGKIAQQNGSSQQVKDFGRMMEKEHSAANQKLMGFTQKMGIPLPSSLSETHQEMLADFRSKSGNDFDKEYIDLMLKEHKANVEKFEKAKSEVSDNDLKQWISSTLPVIKQHVSHVEKLQEAVKNNN